MALIEAKFGVEEAVILNSWLSVTEDMEMEAAPNRGLATEKV